MFLAKATCRIRMMDGDKLFNEARDLEKRFHQFKQVRLIVLTYNNSKYQVSILYYII